MRETITLRVPSRTRYLSLVRACAAEICQSIEEGAKSDQTVYDVQLAVNEAFVNVVRHAYADDPAGIVEVLFHLQPDKLTVDVVDWGRDFDFDGMAEPDLSEPQEGGYGIFLIRQMMDEVTYRADPAKGNRMQMVKRLKE